MFKVLDEVCKPTKGSKYSAAVDLYAREDIVIGVGETKIVPLGVCIDLKNLTISTGISSPGHGHFLRTHYLQLEPRSSLRAKGLQAGTGIIDIDYPDEIKIIIHNPIGNNFAYMAKKSSFSTNIFTILKGEKIAQILLKEHKTFLMGIETEEKRTGGFGSTGNK
jgi:dUTPase